jgi:hypothetical protein
MSDEEEFALRAATIAKNELAQQLKQASRVYEDSLDGGDPQTAAWALSEYAAAQRKLNSLTGSGAAKQQNNGQLSNATQQFLQRRVAGGEQITPARWQTYLQGHHRAIAAGFEPDTEGYFSAVAGHVDHDGLSGHNRPLDATEAAKISGITPDEYNHYARELYALKQRGLYRE